jgi:epoxyqueuosine reductase QueG
MTNETETETELKTPRSIALATKFISMMENRANRSKEAANNHELISKLTFLIVLGMAYENWGDRIMSVLAVFV